MLPILNRAWLYLVCVVLGFGVCWYFNSAPVCPAVVGKAAQSQTVTVDHIVTKTTKPDGTVVVRQESKQSDKERTVQIVPTPSKSKYSLSLDYLPSLSNPPSMQDTQVEAGARLGDSDFWGTAGYDIKHKQFSLGLRYEW